MVRLRFVDFKQPTLPTIVRSEEFDELSWSSVGRDFQMMCMVWLVHKIIHEYDSRFRELWCQD
jgi:hypothetical protein